MKNQVATTLLEMIRDKNYPGVMFRVLWTDKNGEPQDDLFGYAKWENNELIPLDGDSYSFDDIVQFEITPDDLTVWEEAEVIF